MTAEATEQPDIETAASSPDGAQHESAPRRKGAAQPAPRKRKGPKPRHVPQRTCIVTRATGDKRGLVRLVRTPEGRVEVDETGKKNGRGAYLTRDRAIWEQALNRNVLARALKAEIVPEDLAALRAYAATLPPPPAQPTPITTPEPAASVAPSGTMSE